jgi:hypothetical protein
MGNDHLCLREENIRVINNYIISELYISINNIKMGGWNPINRLYLTTYMYLS